MRARGKDLPKLSLVPEFTDRAWETAAGAGVLFILYLLFDLLTTGHASDLTPAGSPEAKEFPWLIGGMAFTCFATYTMLTILNRFPHTFNYPVQITAENAARQYRLAQRLLRALKAEIVWMFGVLLLGLLDSLGLRTSGVSVSAHLVFVPALIVTLVFYILKAYRAK